MKRFSVKKGFSALLVLVMMLALSVGTSFAEAASADVVVVGGGLAGLTAAISATEQGAKVILVEKMPMTGGSSAYSGGGISAPGSSVQAEFSITDSAEGWHDLWVERQAQSLNESAQYPDMERVDAMIEGTPALIEWFKDLGFSHVRPEGYGVDTVERIHYIATRENGNKGGGAALLKELAEVASEKGVEIRTETKALELVQAEDGTVTGVVVETANGQETISAKAVILAAGGFAASPDALQKYIPSLPPVTSVASPSNTGDGIEMAVKAGAVLYEDPWVIGLYTGVSPAGALSRLGYSANLYVNAQGERFMNEWQQYSLITNDVSAQGGVAYSIWDSSNEAVAALIEENLGENAFKADTFEALAEAAGIDAALADTMALYNSDAAAGKDSVFEKDAAFLTAVETAPYYAIRMVPNIMGTIGGVKTLPTCEVVDADNNPIPGLYAAGENANRAFFNQVYMSGGALAIAATTGKIAGAGAASFAQ